MTISDEFMRTWAIASVWMIDSWRRTVDMLRQVEIMEGMWRDKWVWLRIISRNCTMASQQLIGYGGRRMVPQQAIIGHVHPSNRRGYGVRRSSCSNGSRGSYSIFRYGRCGTDDKWLGQSIYKISGGTVHRWLWRRNERPIVPRTVLPVR